MFELLVTSQTLRKACAVQVCFFLQSNQGKKTVGSCCLVPTDCFFPNESRCGQQAQQSLTVFKMASWRCVERPGDLAFYMSKLDSSSSHSKCQLVPPSGKLLLPVLQLGILPIGGFPSLLQARLHRLRRRGLSLRHGEFAQMAMDQASGLKFGGFCASAYVRLHINIRL